METLIDERLEQYALDHTQAASPLLERLEKETVSSRRDHVMLTGRGEGQLLRLLTKLVGAKRVLEIGMFTGYSALSMASALPDDGELHTCDVDPEAEAIAKRYFAESPDGGKIHVHMGPALETMKSLDAPFDLAFIDADKENYPNYYEPVFELIRAGGLILFDNVLWSGKVLDPQDAETRAIHELNERVHEDDRVEHVMTTVRDGLLIAQKL